MKITAKQFAGFKRAHNAAGFNGITFNDGYNVPTFGVTKAQYDVLAKAASEMLGMEGHRVTLNDLKKFFGGEKVHLTRASDDLIKRAEAAFPG